MHTEGNTLVKQQEITAVHSKRYSLRDIEQFVWGVLTSLGKAKG